MKFGKSDDISSVDFSLPETHRLSKEYLSGKVDLSSNHTTLYTGATSWNNSAWKGVIYPPNAKKVDFIRHYSQQFNSIELNATHYRTPSDETILQWLSETPEDFKFCPKVLQAISHRNDMITNKELVNRFIVQLSKLGEKLGCVFIQLPPYFKAGNLPYLEKFLKAWPQELPLAVELRDQGIYENPEDFKKYADILNKYNAIPLITDVSGRRDLLHMLINSDKIFVRWVGNGLHKTDYERIDEWIQMFENWNGKGVKEMYFMLHQPENLFTPEIGEYLRVKLENIQYIGHRGPKTIQEPPNLFT